MTPSRSLRESGLTLVELMFYCAITAVISAAVYSMVQNSSMLTAKITSLNCSHDALRITLDRLAHELQGGRNVPTLIDTTGATVASGSAAGLYFDRMIGTPYELNPVSLGGSIAATATTFPIDRPILETGNPPVPSVNDALIIPLVNGSVRCRITSISYTGSTGAVYVYQLGVAAPVGQTISWVVNQPVWAELVHQEAFIVMPNTASGHNELRYYPNYELQPNLNDPTKYAVITDQVSTQAGENTPFSIQNVNGDISVLADLRMLAWNYSNWLAPRQANSFNTYCRMAVSLTSRLRPTTSQ